MNKTCARCEKTVYPTEELKCLDKVWHKGCFKCQECGMTLNMRTYKGYGKLPYCEAHVPKAKHTTMAETPELKRIAENTKIQSNVKYHADFEKSKGKFTQVADDPETLRIKANTRIISNVAYHGDLEKKAQMEKQRQINENGELVEVPTDYHQQIDNYATEMLPPPHLPPKNHYQTPVTQYQAPAAQYQTSHQYSQSGNSGHQNYSHHVSAHQNASANQNVSAHQNVSTHQNVQTHHNAPHQNISQHQSVSNHQNAQNLIPPPQSYTNQNITQNSNLHQNMNAQVSHQNMSAQNISHQNMSAQNVSHQNISTQNISHQNMSAQNSHQNVQSRQYQEQYYPQQNQKRDEYQYQYQDYNYGQQQKIGRIQDYDPLSDGPRAAPNTQRNSATLIYNSTTNDKRGAHQPSQSQQTRQIGRVTELDPLANEVPQPPRQSAHQNQVNQNVFIAMYDYEANDSDEVSFREGDLISNVSPIDEGWMTGQVLRTGRAGMLPANYVAHYEHNQQY